MNPGLVLTSYPVRDRHGHIEELRFVQRNGQGFESAVQRVCRGSCSHPQDRRTGRDSLLSVGFFNCSYWQLQRSPMRAPQKYDESNRGNGQSCNDD